MYNTLLRIYRKTGEEKYLTNAVSKGWITAEEKEAIMEEA